MSHVSSNNSYLHYNGSAYHDRKLVLSTVYDNAPHDWELPAWITIWSNKLEKKSDLYTISNADGNAKFISLTIDNDISSNGTIYSKNIDISGGTAVIRGDLSGNTAKFKTLEVDGTDINNIISAQTGTKQSLLTSDTDISVNKIDLSSGIIVGTTKHTGSPDFTNVTLSHTITSNVSIIPRAIAVNDKHMLISQNSSSNGSIVAYKMVDGEWVYKQTFSGMITSKPGAIHFMDTDTVVSTMNDCLIITHQTWGHYLSNSTIPYQIYSSNYYKEQVN